METSTVEFPDQVIDGETIFRDAGLGAGIDAAVRCRSTIRPCG